jgi:hypothetical protein
VTEHPFDPPISHFVVFSGGGGLIERAGEADVGAGETLLRVRGVPASFDPETFVVNLEGATLKEIVIKIPSRQYVEDNLRREGAAAQRLIELSVDVGPRRAQIINIAEDIAKRTYLDEEVELTIWVVAAQAGRAKVKMSYFIDDARFKWKPTITVEMGEVSADGTTEVRVRGMVAISNESAHRLTDVDISFADFAREFAADAYNYRVPPEEMKNQMRRQVMKKMMFS